MLYYIDYIHIRISVLYFMFHGWCTVYSKLNRNLESSKHWIANHDSLEATSFRSPILSVVLGTNVWISFGYQWLKCQYPPTPLPGLRGRRKGSAKHRFGVPVTAPHHWPACAYFWHALASLSCFWRACEELHIQVAQCFLWRFRRCSFGPCRSLLYPDSCWTSFPIRLLVFALNSSRSFRWLHLRATAGASMGERTYHVAISNTKLLAAVPCDVHRSRANDAISFRLAVGAFVLILFRRLAFP